MTSPGANGPTTSTALKRYGPLVAIIVVLVVIAGVVVLAGGSDDGDPTAGPPATGDADAAGDVATPITYADAVADGTVDDVEWADNCDPETGRIAIPSVYAAPCVPRFAGDNGGVTSPGVTAEKITVVAYTAPANGDALAALQGAADEPEQVVATRRDFTAMLQDVSETYGRTVDVVEFAGTGDGDDAVAAQADAVNIAETIAPFAVIGGPALTPVFAEEMARREIICIGCALGLPDSFTQEHAPYIWGGQPSSEEFLVNLGAYIRGNLAGKKAEFAGDDATRAKDRVFGVAHFEQDPPVFSALSERIAECNATPEYQAAVTETYVFDMGTLPDRAATIIAKMKAAGVTTLIFLGDPLMPIYLTQQATLQDYHPEWVIAGTVLTDTTTLARLYDPNQWKSAFGVSNLAARTPRELAGSYRLHEWYFGRPPTAAKTDAVILPPLNQLFLGIHMAGANLTPATFEAGLFAYPASGGGPTTPTISYGPDSGFTMIGDDCEPSVPRPDYYGVDDSVEIWWDADAAGVDEQGKEGVGMWAYANDAERYAPGEMAASGLNAFEDEGSVRIFDAVPAEDRAPDYPSPAASPTGS